MSTVVQYLNENGLSYLWTKIQGINPSYNNTNSGLTATTMQDAIDELATGSSAVPSSTTPVMDGTASIGSETTYARGDHVHPHDTSKVDVTGDTMTGTLKVIDVNSATDTYKEIWSDVTTTEVKAQDSSLTTSSTMAEWQAALLKAICAKYPNRTDTIFKGRLQPSSHAWYEVFIYNTSNLSSGLPQYSFGLWRQYVDSFVKFGTVAYNFSSTNVNTNTTYSAGTDLSLSGTTINHDNSGATSGTYGTNSTTALTPGFGSTFNVIGMAINARGHVTSAASHTVKMPNSTATTAANGLMTTSQVTKLNGIATGATAGVSGGTTSTVTVTLGAISAHNYVSGKTATISVPSGYNINRCYIRGWYIQGTTCNTYVNIYNINISGTTLSISAANLDSSTATSSDTKVSVYFGWIK